MELIVDTQGGQPKQRFTAETRERLLELHRASVQAWVRAEITGTWLPAYDAWDEFCSALYAIEVAE